MAALAQRPESINASSVFPANFVELQERNKDLVTRLNRVMVDTMRAVRESEMEFIRLESEQFVTAIVPVDPSNDLVSIMFVYWEEWQNGAKNLRRQICTVSDLIRKGNRDILHIYQRSLQEAVKPFQMRFS